MLLRQAQDGERGGGRRCVGVATTELAPHPYLLPRAIAYNWNEALTTPSPLWGGIEGGGMEAAFLSDLPQKEGGSEAIGVVSTPTLYPSPQGAGGRQRRT